MNRVFKPTKLGDYYAAEFPTARVIISRGVYDCANRTENTTKAIFELLDACITRENLKHESHLIIMYVPYREGVFSIRTPESYKLDPSKDIGLVKHTAGGKFEPGEYFVLAHTPMPETLLLATSEDWRNINLSHQSSMEVSE